MIRLVPMLLVAVGLQGCIIVCPEPPVCTDLAASSVSLDVVHPEGGAIEGAEAWYRANGGELQLCERIEASSFVCGWEESGEIEIQVEAPGFLPASDIVYVEADECHVYSEHREIVLEPDEIVCSEEAVPSLVLEVIDEAGEPIEEAFGYYVVDEACEADASPCEAVGGQLVCGIEEAGELHVLIDAEGYLPEERSYVIEADLCHVETQYDEIILEHDCPEP